MSFSVQIPRTVSPWKFSPSFYNRGDVELTVNMFESEEQSTLFPAGNTTILDPEHEEDNPCENEVIIQLASTN